MWTLAHESQQRGDTSRELLWVTGKIIYLFEASSRTLLLKRTDLEQEELIYHRKMSERVGKRRLPIVEWLGCSRPKENKNQKSKEGFLCSVPLLLGLPDKIQEAQLNLNFWYITNNYFSIKNCVPWNIWDTFILKKKNCRSKILIEQASWILICSVWQPGLPHLNYRGAIKRRAATTQFGGQAWVEGHNSVPRTEH